ncbi:hypothetical protein StoSoilA2_21460 [Arthrobacter sp. StoSoilA2]|nr:hypothetical protein StoSoilA2_21460 [Arthrobacter sp. StoSoilA2]
MSTLFTSDWLVQPPDWPGSRMFSRLPSNNKAMESRSSPTSGTRFPPGQGGCWGVWRVDSVQTLRRVFGPDSFGAFSCG